MEQANFDSNCKIYIIVYSRVEKNAKISITRGGYVRY